MFVLINETSLPNPKSVSIIQNGCAYVVSMPRRVQCEFPSSKNRAVRGNISNLQEAVFTNVRDRSIIYLVCQWKFCYGVFKETIYMQTMGVTCGY